VSLLKRLLLPFKKILNRIRIFKRHMSIKKDVRSTVYEKGLTDKERSAVLGWGSRKKQRFNTLVMDGMSMESAYKIVEYNKGLIYVDKD